MWFVFFYCVVLLSDTEICKTLFGISSGFTSLTIYSDKLYIELKTLFS